MGCYCEETLRSWWERELERSQALGEVGDSFLSEGAATQKAEVKNKNFLRIKKAFVSKGRIRKLKKPVDQ